ncbi:DUF418 domain-containing protein [Geomicrobium sp. JCM 19038]|uniref:DUF418 domain-containing protein n=1 Tax=Geomicrobium sp. JCM 19038 TaxID=1460635 RepID=UPI00045F298A|nr:DUF418 domain-containing protein [Geomicrobium sp. JCM 19038]GAK09470.1 membrane protein [Geomicrobium sp. JCM 19038]
MSPLAPEDRWHSIDIIRGIALLGIFIANISLFQIPHLFISDPPLSEGSDQWIQLFIDLFIQNKFFSLFAILFGLGSYIFLSRAQEKGNMYRKLYIRRMLILFFIGLLHLIFIWYGDILHSYAVAGVVLLVFYRRKLKTIIVWICLFASLLFLLVVATLFVPQEKLEAGIEGTRDANAVQVEQAVSVYHNASYIDWIVYRFSHEVIPVLKSTPFSMLTALFMFLLGLSIGKSKLVSHFEEKKSFIKRLWLITFILSLTISGVMFSLYFDMFDLGARSDVYIQMFMMFSAISHSLFYFSSLLWLLQSSRWQKILKPFQFVGRMALTNYLLQSIIGVGFFAGFGLFGSLNLRLGLAVVVVVFLIQILVSYYWLKAFHYGPMEWLWRTATYGKRQPLKKR